jgi:endonuclease/exonuclease/phosphatase family metal-dependent hydrolase
MATIRQIRIASYNIHRCVGIDGRCDPGRVAEVLREIEADVVALQEVDADHWVQGGIDQLEFLAAATGFEAVPGPTLRGHRGHYGNALLTRLPLHTVYRHDLSVVGREPRGVIDVDVEAHGRYLRVVTTHLGLRPLERRTQLRALVGLVDKRESERVVLLGDMNEWMPGALRALHTRLAAAPRLRTFPAYRPMLALDRIWVRPRGSMRDVRVHHSHVARMASDHLPLVASIDL